MKHERLQRYSEIVEDVCAFEDALERPLPTTGWVNTLKRSIDDVFSSFEDADVAFERLTWKPDAFRLTGTHAQFPGRRIEYLLGFMQVQEEAAMLPVTFMDIHAKMLEADGTLTREIMPDLLHPKEKGYAIWAAAIEPFIAKTLGDKPVAP